MNDNTLSSEQLLDIAMISVIMGDAAIKPAYDDNNPDIGFVATAEMVAKWALEFWTKTQNMTPENWEEAHFNSAKFGLEGDCWDDHIILFAEKKTKEWLASQ